MLWRRRYCPDAWWFPCSLRRGWQPPWRRSPYFGSGAGPTWTPYGGNYYGPAAPGSYGDYGYYGYPYPLPDYYLYPYASRYLPSYSYTPSPYRQVPGAAAYGTPPFSYLPRRLHVRPLRAVLRRHLCASIRLESPAPLLPASGVSLWVLLPLHPAATEEVALSAHDATGVLLPRRSQGPTRVACTVAPGIARATRRVGVSPIPGSPCEGSIPRLQ